MNILKIAVALTIIASSGMQYPLVAQTPESTVVQLARGQQEQFSDNINVIKRPFEFEFKPLPYAYDSLEPFLDKLTVEIHYSKHHKAYYENFIDSIKGSEMETMDINDIFKKISTRPAGIRNNGGGYYNHTFYWEGMTSEGGNLRTGNLSKAIIQKFSSFDEFKKQFSDAGITRFGSGWVWLCLDDKGQLYVCSTPNQDNPLMDITEKRGTPLLAMDVWEHAYYLKYQSGRTDYIDAFWNIVNWEEVTRRYEAALLLLNTR